jgi:hypothetical protein
VAHPAAATVLDRLPEAAQRWRAALLGLEPLPPIAGRHGGADRSSDLLMAALDLLERICAVVQHGDDDLPAPLAAEDTTGLPLSVRYKWPPDVAWDVQVFEAVLGDATRAAFPNLVDSFVSRDVKFRQAVDHHAAPVTPPVARRLDDRRNATLACALLAIEWAMCAKSLAAVEAPDIAPDVRWLRVLMSSVRGHGRDPDDGTAATLVLATGAGERSHEIELRVFLDERALARVRTGTIHREPGGAEHGPVCVIPSAELLADTAVPGRSASVAIRRGPCLEHGPRARPNVWRVTPRVLTDEGVPRANIAYATARGVVCVTAYANTSFVIRVDGSIGPALSWPHPIVSELPVGEGVTMAWNNGSAAWMEPRGYVMYRVGVDGPVTIKDLPFRPSWGTWWRDRVYWTCFTSGVGSWAPGLEPAFALSELNFIAVDAQEQGLLLSPGIRNEDGVLQRRRVANAWRLHEDRPPERVSLGSLGAPTSRSAGTDGWTAIAYPEADVVQLASADGRVLSMTCYYPFKVAWVEQALLVSTLHGEMLLFSDLVNSLSATGWKAAKSGGHRS